MRDLHINPIEWGLRFYYSKLSSNNISKCIFLKLWRWNIVWTLWLCVKFAPKEIYNIWLDMIKVLEKSRGDTFWITPRLAQDQDHTVLQIRSVLIFNFKNCIQLHNETYGPCHKTLPKCSLQIHWISVRFYEMGDM